MMTDIRKQLSFCRRALALAGLIVLTACASDAAAPALKADSPETPSDPVFLLADIEGAKPDAIDVLLGAPALIRREGAGEYRRYTLNQCALVIILYPDDHGVERASYIDAVALTSDAPKPDLESCLAAG